MNSRHYAVVSSGHRTAVTIPNDIFPKNLKRIHERGTARNRLYVMENEAILDIHVSDPCPPPRANAMALEICRSVLLPTNYGGKRYSSIPVQMHRERRARFMP